MSKDQQEADVIAAVEQAITRWKNAFSSGDTAQHEMTPVMYARPFSTFTGTEEIQDEGLCKAARRRFRGQRIV
jgi:hypothetical protein